ncbi:MAG: peptidylprolyl isomerase [Pseudomonadota bacterium]
MSDAAEALVVRELLLQEARRQGLQPAPEAISDGRRETDDNALIRQLLENALSVPIADETSCQRYYENNKRRFMSQDLFEASHILFAAAPDDEPAYQKAADMALEIISCLQASPASFEDIAREKSDCPSGKEGGRLGQVSRGDTVPEVETFLVALEAGQLCPVPVKSRYGVHVLRLDHKIEGRQLPFDAVQQRIADYLQEASWRRALAQFVQLLAGQAKIEGIQFNAASSPLVQ